nr:EOG090X020Z [Triops cancriformis]
MTTFLTMSRTILQVRKAKYTEHSHKDKSKLPTCKDPCIDEKSIVKHHTLGNRPSISDSSILVEMTAFPTLGKLQPFHVSCSSGALMVIDFHSHITSSEVVGYLAGVWDVNAHNLIVMRAFPCLSRLRDTERAAGVEMAMATEIEKRRLQLVGWYHSHPSAPATPSIRDIDNQLEYEIKMKGSNDTAYKPCIGLICSPYHRMENTDVTVNSSVACYWVMPPSESRPHEVPRPMSMQHSVMSDPSLADDILDQMQRCAEFYKGSPDAINFEDEWLNGVTFIEKLKGSLEPKLRDSSDPRILDYVESLLIFLLNAVHSRVASVADVTSTIFPQLQQLLTMDDVNISRKPTRNTAKGTKPLPDPTSISQVLLHMLVHVCRKVLFIDPSVKENIFNQYFVKLSWAWTMLLVGSFVYLTTRIYCCGDKLKIRRHFGRLVIATVFWWFWTTSFAYFEENYGYCSKPHVQQSRKSCLSKGATWQTLSVSGHSFILVYCSLIIMEEAKALIGWEGIKDCIRIEEHNRSVLTSDDEKEDTGLELLPHEEFDSLKEDYTTFTPYVRSLFILMTVLGVLWDVMLISTILYFHTMVEKFLAAAIAVFVWFFTYRYWFRARRFTSPGLPGEGNFRYMNPADPLSYTKVKRQASLKSSSLNEGRRITSQRDTVPMFMGMPLNALRSQNNKFESIAASLGGGQRIVNSNE